MTKGTTAIENKVLRYLRQEHLFPSPGGVVVACSGGADSLCLLTILHHWRVKLGLEIAAAWFDHGLRPKQADFERARVQDYTRCLGITLQTGQGGTRQHALENGMSIEESARELRYRFLADTCQKLGYHYLATGHTADDNAETVLLHILRGCGVDGLVGIRSCSALPLDDPALSSIRLVRPILPLDRQETEAYCRLKKLKYVRDPSNRSQRYVRNRVRHQILPMLEKINPAVRQALRRLSTAASEATTLIHEQTSALPAAFINANGQVELSRGIVDHIPRALQMSYLRQALKLFLPGLKDINDYQVRKLAELATGSGRGTIIFPAGITATIQGQSIIIWRTAKVTNNSTAPLMETLLTIPGRTRYGIYEITSSMVNNHSPVRTAPDAASFDAALAGTNLTVGPWRRGDRIQPLGMAGQKKLQDLFTDAKIARPLRNDWPVIRSGERVLWVPGLRQAEWARVKTGTRKVLRLEYRLLT
jgi:tRNA(Ile)-lysidine synthase